LLTLGLFFTRVLVTGILNEPKILLTQFIIGLLDDFLDIESDLIDVMVFLTG
jgi:hypothetical protein